MFARIRQFPARFQTFLITVLSALTLFGVPWSEEQLAGLTFLTAAAIALWLEPPTRKT